jgi:hypothetical protein
MEAAVILEDITTVDTLEDTIDTTFIALEGTEEDPLTPQWR